MSSLPLLRLPSLPLEDILQQLEFIDLFHLSQCSTKAALKVKSSAKRKYELTADFNFTSRLLLTDNTGWVYAFRAFPSKRLEKGRTNGSRNFGFGETKKMNVPVFLDQKSLCSYWDDAFIGLQTICLHILEIFNCPIDNFISDPQISVKQFKSIVGKLMEKQETFKTFYFRYKNFTAEDLKWTLDTVKVTEDLSINIQYIKDFKYQFKAFPKCLSIEDSCCLTLENLLSLKSCKVIDLSRTLLSHEDCDVFIKSWKAGNYPKLEVLSIVSHHLKDKKPIAGMLIGRHWRRSGSKQKSIPTGIFSIYGGYDIQRDDGVMGTIIIDEYNFEYNLRLIVWL